MKQITFSTDSKNKPTLKESIQSTKLVEDYFKTKEDNSQAQINLENIKWVRNNIPDCVNIIKYKNKNIGNTFIVPCNKKLMNQFLSKKTNENQLFEEIKRSINY